MTIQERRDVAKEFLTTANLDIPALLDDIEDTAATGYASLPDRLYLIGKDGKIAFAGDRGPRGFKPDMLEKAIKTEVEKISAATTSEEAAEKGAVVEAAAK